MSEDKELVDEKAAPISVESVSGAAVHSTEQAAAVIGTLFDVAQPDAIFGKPAEHGDYTIITASEVMVGMGVGFGAGGGPTEEGDEAAGGGGGGGGGSLGRPVAAIIVGPQGVRVEPIVDATKISIAFFTAIGAMFMSWRAMRRAAQ